MRFAGDFQSVVGADDQIGLPSTGFYEDAETFRDTVETEKRGLCTSFTWNISDTISLTYELECTEQEVPFDRGVVHADGFGFSPCDTFAGESGAGPITNRLE